MIVLHSAGARSRASVACHVPAAGEATSANQKYGGPPCRSRDLAATLPSGAISESSPSSGFSAAKTTRKGAPFHGAIGEGRTASSAASSQLPGAPWARASAAEKRDDEKCAGDQQQCCRGSSKLACWKQWSPLLSRDRNLTNIAKLWLNHGKIRHQAKVAAAHLNCSSTNHFLSLSEHFLVSCAGSADGLGQGPTARAAAIALLQCREFQVAAQVHLPGGDGLIDVAADGVQLARPRIDMRDHLAMGAPDRARVGAAARVLPGCARAPPRRWRRRARARAVRRSDRPREVWSW